MQVYNTTYVQVWGVLVLVHTNIRHYQNPQFMKFQIKFMKSKVRYLWETSTKRRGGLYAGCDNFSRDYALPSDKAWLHCYLSEGRGGQARGVAEREAERCSRR